MSRRVAPAPNGWGGQVALVGLCLAALLLVLPTTLALDPLIHTPPEPTTLLAPLTPVAPKPTPVVVPPAPTDEGASVTLLRSDGSQETLTMADYLFGVVAAEMPASFHLEALKAQAVAARTYTATRQNSGAHPVGTLCDDSSCCQAYVDPALLEEKWGVDYSFYRDKIRTAVAETDGLMVYYEGQPIEALFFAAAAGRTVDAQAVWGNEVAYLVGVNSPEGEEVPNYHSQVILSKKEVEAIIFGGYPAAKLGDSPETWLKNATYTPSGSIATLEVGGLTLTGGEVRNLFSLRSATFSFHWEGSNLVFNVTGYGHGVGMSQYGANTMATEGKDFREILEWYYTGTSVK